MGLGGARGLALVLLLTATCAVATGSALSSDHPVASARAVAVTGSSAAARSLAVPQPSAGIGRGVATMSGTAGDPAWLVEINRYRVASGLAPVADQPQWDTGILDHLTYVAKTPK